MNNITPKIDVNIIKKTSDFASFFDLKSRCSLDFVNWGDVDDVRTT